MDIKIKASSATDVTIEVRNRNMTSLYTEKDFLDHAISALAILSQLVAGSNV